LGDVEKAVRIENDAVLIVGFNVGTANSEVGDQLRLSKIRMIKHKVIYSLLSDLEDIIKDKMPFERTEINVGKAEVLATFQLTGKRRTSTPVAGCKIVQGSIRKADNVYFRILRKGDMIAEDIPLTSLYHEKNEIGEIGQGNECGLTLEGFS